MDWNYQIKRENQSKKEYKTQLNKKKNQGFPRQIVNESYQKIVVSAQLGFAHGTTHDPDGILKVWSISCGGKICR